MDVEFDMRVFVLTACLFAPIASYATDFRIFELELNLRENCSLEVRRSDGTVEIKEFPFKNKTKCVVVPVSETNVPRIEFVRGDYVLLVESQTQSGENCRAEQVGVAVSRNGKVGIGSRIQKPGVCEYSERKDFEILHRNAVSNQ
jgi:hypothetical protein